MVSSLKGDESLIVLEYSEERPPILGNRGMVSNVVNYFRGVMEDCPVSAGGGDRPMGKKVKGQRNIKAIVVEEEEEGRRTVKSSVAISTRF